jgi:hypothetical protein
MVDVKDDESFCGVFLFSAFRQKKGERHRVRAAGDGQTDAA